MPESRLRWLLTAVVAGAIVASTPVITQVGATVAMSSAPGAATINTGMLVAQQGGPCEKTRRPTCNRPGRRSTHK